MVDGIRAYRREEITSDRDREQGITRFRNVPQSFSYSGRERNSLITESAGDTEAGRAVMEEEESRVQIHEAVKRGRSRRAIKTILQKQGFDVQEETAQPPRPSPLKAGGFYSPRYKAPDRRRDTSPDPSPLPAPSGQPYPRNYGKSDGRFDPMTSTFGIYTAREYELGTQRIQQRQSNFMTSKGMERIDTVASYMTGGGGKTREERGLVGGALQLEVGGSMGLPQLGWSFLQSSVEKIIHTTRGIKGGLFGADDVGSSIITTKKGGLFNLESHKGTFDPTTQEGLANVMSLGVGTFTLGKARAMNRQNALSIPDLDDAKGTTTFKYYDSPLVEELGSGVRVSRSIPDLDASTLKLTIVGKPVRRVLRINEGKIKGVQVQNLLTGETVTQLSKKGLFKTKVSVIKQNTDITGAITGSISKTSLLRNRVGVRNPVIASYKPKTRIRKSYEFTETKRETQLEGWMIDYNTQGKTLKQSNVMQTRTVLEGEFRLGLFKRKKVKQTVVSVQKSTSESIGKGVIESDFNALSFADGKGSIISTDFTIEKSFTFGVGKVRTKKATIEPTGKKGVLLDSGDIFQRIGIKAKQPSRSLTEGVVGAGQKTSLSTKDAFRVPKAGEFMPDTINKLFKSKKAKQQLVSVQESPELGTMTSKLNIEARSFSSPDLDVLGFQPIGRTRPRARSVLVPVSMTKTESKADEVLSSRALSGKLDIKPIQANLSAKALNIEVAQPLTQSKYKDDYLYASALVPKMQMKQQSISKALTTNTPRQRAIFNKAIVAPAPPSPPSTFPEPQIPIFPDFGGDILDTPKRKKKVKKRTRQFKYAPDLTSAILGIKGKRDKVLDPFSPRPITGVL